MTIKNKNSVGDKNRKISGKKIMLVTALLSGGVIIRVNNHVNNSFGHAPKEVINFDLTLESTDVLIDDSGTFYVGQGTPIENFDIYDFVTILDESGKVISNEQVKLEWDIKEYFAGEIFGTKGEYLITITATMDDGRMGELEYKLVVKEGHVFEEITPIKDVEIEQTNTTDLIDFQEHFRVLNSSTGKETITDINSTLEDDDLRNLGTTQVIFYTELDGTRFTNSVHISVVDTVAPVIELEDSFEEEFEWDIKGRTINISDLEKTLGDFSLDQFATAYDGSGEFELSWDFEEVMTDKLDEIGTQTVTITAIDSSGNVRNVEIYVNISTVKFEFKPGITEVAFELLQDANLNESIYQIDNFYNVFDASGNPIAEEKLSWNLTEEMLSEIGEYRLTMEVLDDKGELIGSKGVSVEVRDTTAPVAVLVSGANTIFEIEVDQFNSIDNIFMYLDGIANINSLVTVTDNSGIWGYRFEYNNQELTDDFLRTPGEKDVTLVVFDYDKDGEPLNRSTLNDENGLPISLKFNIVDKTAPIVNIINDVIDLEVVQNATKDMIEILNYVEVKDNSGSFTWDLRVKSSQDAIMDYRDMLSKTTDPSGVELELIVKDASGNVTYTDVLLIVRDTQAPVLEMIKDKETININPSANEMNGYRDISSYVRVSDNSGNVTINDLIWDFDTVVNAKVAGVYYVTIIAKDNSGNTMEETVIFTVIDEESPTIIVNTKTIQIEANEYMNKTEFEFDKNLNDYITVTDNSGVKPDVEFDYTNVDFGELGTYEVIITATDNAGNSSVDIIEIKVIAGNPKVNLKDYYYSSMNIDDQNVISGIKVEIKEGKIVVEKASDQADVDELLTHLTMDNLLEFLTITGETIESASWDMESMDFQSIGTKDLTLNVTNNFGKTTTMIIEIVVIQEWDSELVLKKSDNFIELEIDTTETRDETWFINTYAVTNYVDYRTHGNPNAVVWELNGANFDVVGSNVITISMDDNGTRHEVSLNLNIVDTTGAQFTMLKDTESVEINDKSVGDYLISDFVTVTDNSGIAPTLSWNLSSQVDFGKEGTYTVTIKAVDASGNVTTKEITFDIGDKTKPVITINDGMDTQTIEINSREESQFNINSFVTATDNSGVAPELEWDIESVDFSTTATYTVTIKAIDKAGNEAIEVTVEFIIVDTIAPTIDIDASGLDELKVEINDKTEVNFKDWLEDYVTVTDNSKEDITLDWDLSTVEFDKVGTYTIVISATDLAGNLSTVDVVFTVLDTTAPTINLVSGKETTEYEVFTTKSEDFKIEDFATCDDATSCTISWDIQSVDFSTVGTYVVTIKAVDAYGNESRQEIIIEVQDTTAPEIIITRPNVLVATGKYDATEFNVNDFATVTDNYDKLVSLTWNIEDVDFDVEGTYTVTIKAVDSNGNEAIEKTVQFNVEEINIVLEPVKDFIIEVDENNLESNFDVDSYFKATEEDGTPVNNIEWNVTDEMLKIYGTHRVKLTITFDTNKTVEMEVTLEVVDTTSPDITVVKQDETIELGDTTSFDNLTPEDFVTTTDNSGRFNYSWDFANVVEQTIAGTYAVTIIAEDLSGNVSQEIINIIVEDNIEPDLVLNEDFNYNNMDWSKATSELSILAGDKAPGEINLWELVTATDLSTGGLAISWNLSDAELNTVGHYTVDILVTDGYNPVTETITVNVIRSTPILNDFNVDNSYNEITVNVDLTNINQAISALEIIVQDKDGNPEDIYTHNNFLLDTLSINQVFDVDSNMEYKVVLNYTYATLADNSDIDTITSTKDVKTLAYSQNDVLGTITDVYRYHKDLIINYEISNELKLLTNAVLVLIDENGNDIVGATHQIDIDAESGTHTFSGLTPNTEYKVEIRLSYDFHDGKNEVTKIADSMELNTLSYSEHDVITDITSITQSPSTVSVDYNISDSYSLIIAGTMKARIYDANTMLPVTGSEVVLTSLSDTIQFTGLNANTSYIVVIEASLNLQDGTTIVKETGSQTTTESYSINEITVNVDNVMVDYDNITFDYEVFDPSGLLVADTITGNKLRVSINNQVFDLVGLEGTVSLENHLNDVTSGTSYDVQIHFDYDLKDGNKDISHETDLYGFVESTRTYELDKDLTLTSHNLASDMTRIYVDYSLRNLNDIGDMSTLSVTIRNKDTDEFEKILFTNLSGISLGDLEGSFELDSLNSNPLVEETVYEITISINYNLNDGLGIQTEHLLLEDAEIQTKDVPLAGYNVISSIERGYTFINNDFNIQDDGTHGTGLLDSFKIALLDENGIPVTNYDYISQSVSAGDNNIKFENLTSDTSYTIVYRIDNPNYTSSNGEDEFIEVTRKVSTRTYDTNLIDVNYNLVQGLTYLHLSDIEITNNNVNFENINYNSVILVITYTTRDGQVITVERDLGALTEGDKTQALFTGIQSNTDVKIEFKLEHDLKDGEGIQSGNKELLIASEAKTEEYDFTFVIENDEVLVTGLTPGFTGDHLVIFEEVEGYIVKDIKEDAFYGDSISFSQLTIPRSLETIGQNAFRSVALTTVNLTSVFEVIPTLNRSINDKNSQAVLVVGASAFRDNNLTSFDFTTTETIGASAFRNNNLNEVVLTDTITFVGDEAFANSGVSKLTTGALLNDSNFGVDTFVGNQINDLLLGNIGVKHTTLGNSSSVLNTNGFNLQFLDTAVGKIDDSSWKYHVTDNRFSKAPIVGLTIGDGITEIGVEAFVSNTLSNVIVGSGVTVIDKFAFQSSTITTLTLGTSVERIEEGAFLNNGISVIDLPDSLEYIGEQAFAKNDINELVLKTNVTQVGSNAFEDNDMTILTVGASLTYASLGNNVFVGNKINSLTLDNPKFTHSSFGSSSDVFASTGFDLVLSNLAVGEIDNAAWEYGTSGSTSNVKVKNITIGDGITAIGDYTFFGNTLSVVEIGNGVETIGSNAFDSTGISDLTLGNSVVSLGYRAFASNNISQIKNFPQTLEIIGDEAFISNNIGELSLPNTVLSIGVESFRHNQMTSLTLAEGITPAMLMQDAFSQNNINKLQLGNPEFTNTSFGVSQKVFADQLSLTYTSGATGVIPDRAWIQDSNTVHKFKVTQLDLGTGITEIGVSVFDGNELGHVVIPQNIQRISYLAFANSLVEKVTIETGVDNSVFDDNTFAGNSISEVILGEASILHSSLGTYWRVYDQNGIKVTYTEDAVGQIPANAWNGEMIKDHPANVTELNIGSGITVIGASAFANNGITNLVLQNTSIEKIEDYAFDNAGVQTILFNSSLTSIGNYSFINNVIPNIDFSNTSLEKIGNYAFDDISLATVTFNSELIEIGNYAFRNNALVTVDLSTTLVSKIGSYAFDNAGVQTLKLSDSLVTINDYAFRNNTISNLDFSNTKLEIIGIEAFANSSVVTVKFNGSLTIIGTGAFKDNSIATIDFSGTKLESIGGNAFSGNVLTSLVIPETVNIVGEEAFANNQITNLVIESDMSATNMGANSLDGNIINELTLSNVDFAHDTLGESTNVFASTGFKLNFSNTAIGKILDNAWEYSTEQTTSNVKINNVSIGDGVTEIGNSAFLGNNLNTINIGNGVHTIGDNVFDSTGVSTLTLGDSIVSIGDESFANNNLSTVVFPETLVSIGNGVFKNNSFTNLVLPNSVNYIGDNAFENNGMLTLVIGELLSDENFGVNSFVGNEINHLTIGNIGFKHDSLGVSSNVFESTGFKLTFEDTAVGEIGYRAWRYYAGDDASLQVPITDLTIGSGITKIGESSFYQNELNEVIIGNSVKTIERFAFYDSGISKVTLGTSLEAIEEHAFQLNAIPSLSLPTSLKTIGVSSFRYNNLTELTIPNNVSLVEDNAFRDNSVTKLTIEDKITQDIFGTNTFQESSISELVLNNVNFAHDSFGLSDTVFSSTGLKVIYTDKAIGEIPTRAWRYEVGDDDSSQVQLASVDMGIGITAIGTSAFAYSDIGELVLGDNVETIASHGFYFANVSKVTFGNSLVTIGSYAFQGNSLSQLAIPTTLKTIGISTFRANNLTEITIPNNLDSVGSTAFRDNSITNLTIEDKVTPDIFGTNTFLENSISTLTLGNVGIVHDTFGASNEVFNNSGFKIIYTDDAIGGIPNSAWRYQVSSAASSQVQVTEVTMGTGITSIGNSSFAYNKLGELVLGNNVETIGLGGFYYANISKVTFNSVLETIADEAFQGNSLTQLSMPTSLETIGISSFANNNITDVTIPNNLQTVGDSAFANNGVTKLTIEDQITEDIFGTNTFDGSSISDLILENVNFTYNSFGISNRVFNNSTFKITYTDEAVGTIPYRAWRYHTDTSLVKVTDVVIGTGVTAIDSSAFAYNNIGELVMGDNVESIASHGFYFANVSKITFGSSLETIGDYVFQGNALTQLTLPTSLKTMGISAFRANSLTEVTIPSNVTSVGSTAFRANSITKLTVGASVSASVFSTNTFLENSISTLILGSSDIMHNTFGVSDEVFNNSGIKITYTDDASGTIIDRAWRYQLGNEDSSQVLVTGLTMGSGITGIGASVFYMNKVGAVTIGSSVETVGGFAFHNAGVTQVTLPATISSIGSFGFTYNTALTKVTFLGGVVVDAGAFSYSPTFVNASGQTIT